MRFLAHLEDLMSQDRQPDQGRCYRCGNPVYEGDRWGVCPTPTLTGATILHLREKPGYVYSAAGPEESRSAYYMGDKP